MDQGHNTPLGYGQHAIVRNVIQIQLDSKELWPRHRFWLCVLWPWNYDIRKGHDTPLGCGHQMYEILCRSDRLEVVVCTRCEQTERAISCIPPNLLVVIVVRRQQNSQGSNNHQMAAIDHHKLNNVITWKVLPKWIKMWKIWKPYLFWFESYGSS